MKAAIFNNSVTETTSFNKTHKCYHLWEVYMRSFTAINKRNLGLYFRDYSAVFFSLLSMLIIIILMVFFLGDIGFDA